MLGHFTPCLLLRSLLCLLRKSIDQSQKFSVFPKGDNGQLTHHVCSLLELLHWPSWWKERVKECLNHIISYQRGNKSNNQSIIKPVLKIKAFVCVKSWTATAFQHPPPGEAYLQTHSSLMQSTLLAVHSQYLQTGR
jgi:hypothetical protein